MYHLTLEEILHLSDFAFLLFFFKASLNFLLRRFFFILINTGILLLSSCCSFILTPFLENISMMEDIHDDVIDLW